MAAQSVSVHTTISRHFIATFITSDIMGHMRSTIHFNIWQEDGMYVAAAVDVPIATEGGTFEELQENIRDVVAVYFEDEDLASLGFERLPTILTNFEVSPQAYAGRT